MTDTIETTELNPMLELTSEQLARVAALGSAGEFIRSGGIVRGNPGSTSDMIDLAEYIVHGHTIIRSYGKKGSEWYSRINVDGPIESQIISTTVNTDDTDAAA